MLRNVTSVLAALLITIAPSVHAQTSRPEFEVASIKQEPPGPNIGTGFVRSLGGGRLSAEKALLRVLIWNAYRVRDYQVVGGPDCAVLVRELRRFHLRQKVEILENLGG